MGSGLLGQDSSLWSRLFILQHMSKGQNQETSLFSHWSCHFRINSIIFITQHWTFEFSALNAMFCCVIFWAQQLPWSKQVGTTRPHVALPGSCVGPGSQECSPKGLLSTTQESGCDVFNKWVKISLKLSFEKDFIFV